MQDSLVINQTEITYVIQLEEVLYCKADRGYCLIHLLDGKIITNTRTLSDLSKHLTSNFIRISQSFLINKRYIRKICKKSKCIELANGFQLPYTIKSGDLINLISKTVLQDEIA